MTPKGWLPIIAGVGVGAVGLLLWQKHAAASAPALPASTTPSSVQVGLQPGATTVAVAKGGGVILVLPTGATWSTATTPVTPLNPTAAQPTGNISFNVTMGAASGIITANWIDSSGRAQSTTINVAVA